MVGPVFRLRNEGRTEAVSPGDLQMIDNARSRPRGEWLEIESVDAEAVDDVAHTEKAKR